MEPCRRHLEAFLGQVELLAVAVQEMKRVGGKPGPLSSATYGTAGQVLDAKDAMRACADCWRAYGSLTGAAKPATGTSSPKIPKIGSAAWNAVKAEMKENLRGCARRAQTIAYSDLSAQVKSASIPYDSPLMGRILGEISTEEDAAGRGMLSVVVIHKTGDTMPGPGFFELADELGRDVSDQLKLWSEEMRLVQKRNGAKKGK